MPINPWTSDILAVILQCSLALDHKREHMPNISDYSIGWVSDSIAAWLTDMNDPATEFVSAVRNGGKSFDRNCLSMLFAEPYINSNINQSGLSGKSKFCDSAVSLTLILGGGVKFEWQIQLDGGLNAIA